jgi:hypothetical protein
MSYPFNNVRQNIPCNLYNYDFNNLLSIRDSSQHASQQTQTVVLLSLRPDLLAKIFAINIIPTITTIPDTDIEITQFSSIGHFVRGRVLDALGPSELS